jgi:hypothetical protein
MLIVCYLDRIPYFLFNVRAQGLFYRRGRDGIS